MASYNLIPFCTFGLSLMLGVGYCVETIYFTKGHDNAAKNDKTVAMRNVPVNPSEKQSPRVPSGNPDSQQPPTQAQQPPSQVQQPPSYVHQPPPNVQQPPPNIQQPPRTVQQPPLQVQQPPPQVQQPPPQIQQPQLVPASNEIIPSEDDYNNFLNDASKNSSRRTLQRGITMRINQISSSQDQIDAVSKNLIDIFDGTIAFDDPTMFLHHAKKEFARVLVTNAQEIQVASNATHALTLVRVVANVHEKVSILNYLLDALNHRWVFTIPQYIHHTTPLLAADGSIVSDSFVDDLLKTSQQDAIMVFYGALLGIMNPPLSESFFSRFISDIVELDHWSLRVLKFALLYSAYPMYEFGKNNAHNFFEETLVPYLQDIVNRKEDISRAKKDTANSLTVLQLFLEESRYKNVPNGWVPRLTVDSDILTA